MRDTCIQDVRYLSRNPRQDFDHLATALQFYPKWLGGRQVDAATGRIVGIAMGDRRRPFEAAPKESVHCEHVTVRVLVAQFLKTDNPPAVLERLELLQGTLMEQREPRDLTFQRHFPIFGLLAHREPGLH